MELKIINTGSVGNCYAIVVNGKYLLLDCGVPYIQIAKALQFQMASIVGCLLTHEHQDHALSARDLNRRGIKIFTSAGTASAIKCGTVVKHLEKYQVGEFTIRPFNVPHDAIQPFGFLVHHPAFGILCFITDLMYCEYNFPGITHLMIEANYSRALLKNDPEALQRRILTSHMSIESACQFVDLHKETLEVVILIHLSDRNSEEEDYLERIQKITGKRVYIANKNQTISL